LVVTSAPGKLILMGEHAVVFGKPAIAMAVDLRLRCSVERAGRYTVNGHPLDRRYHSYIVSAIDQFWKGGGLDIRTIGDLPSGSGLGSSAALTVAFVRAIEELDGKYDEESVARRAFLVELHVQGRASPIDTSASTHGHGILISGEGNDPLWTIELGDRRWDVHHLDVPQMSMVIGYTGIHAPTGPLVAKVKRYYDRTNFAKETIEEIADLTEEGQTRLKTGDVVGLGELMTRNHKLLSILGVSCPELNRLVRASLPYSYGAKLTGSGGGGSMVALTDEPERVCEAIRRHGGTPFLVRTGVEGVRLEK